MTDISYNRKGRMRARATCELWFAVGSFVFFAGLYLSPERIKLFYAVYLAALVLRCVLFNKKAVCINAIDFAWIAYLVIGLLGGIIGGIGFSAGFVEFSLSLILGLFVNVMIMRDADRDKQIKAIWALCAIVLLGCALQFVAPELLSKITSFTLGEQQYAWHMDFVRLMKRVVGFSYQTGVTAHYLCLFELLLIATWITSGTGKQLKRLFCAVGFLVGFALILLTEKRSSLLVVLVLFAVLFYLAYQKRFLKYGVFFAAAFAVAILATETGRGLIARTLGSNPLSGRLDIYEILWDMIGESPLIGNGLGSTLIQVTGYTNGHNIYIQTWAECGIIGLSILVFILGVNLIRAMRVLKRALKANTAVAADVFCVGYQIYFIVVGMFANPLYDIYPLVMYLLTTGMVKSVRLGSPSVER